MSFFLFGLFLLFVVWFSGLFFLLFVCLILLWGRGKRCWYLLCMLPGVLDLL